MAEMEKYQPETEGLTDDSLIFETWMNIKDQLSSSNTEREKYNELVKVLHRIIAIATDQALIEMAKYEKKYGAVEPLWQLLDKFWRLRDAYQKNAKMVKAEKGPRLLGHPREAFFKHLAEMEEGYNNTRSIFEKFNDKPE